MPTVPAAWSVTTMAFIRDLLTLPSPAPVHSRFYRAHARASGTGTDPGTGGSRTQRSDGDDRALVGALPTELDHAVGRRLVRVDEAGDREQQEQRGRTVRHRR